MRTDMNGAGTIQRFRVASAIAAHRAAISFSTASRKASNEGAVARSRWKQVSITAGNERAPMLGMSIPTPGMMNSQQAATT